MDTMRILLLGIDDATRELLTEQLTENGLFSVALCSHDLPEVENDPADLITYQAIVLSDRLPGTVVARTARFIRKHNFVAPIVLLSGEVETRLTARLQHAGVDDILYIAEIDTPVFWWSFMSIVRQAQARMKARDFDTVRNRLAALHESLGTIAHDMNNPLSVIRLAVYNLQREELVGDKRTLLLKLLADNLTRVDLQIKKLNDVHARLAEDTSALAQVSRGGSNGESVSSH